MAPSSLNLLGSQQALARSLKDSLLGFQVTHCVGLTIIMIIPYTDNLKENHHD